MSNYTGILYNSGATQTGVSFRNGLGSVYAISGANQMFAVSGIALTVISSITSYTGTVFNRIIVSGATGTSFSYLSSLSSITFSYVNQGNQVGSFRYRGDYSLIEVSGYTPSSRTSYINYTSYTVTADPGYDTARIFIRGFTNDSISETQGFIYWTKFRLTSPTGIQYFCTNSAFFGNGLQGMNFAVRSDGIFLSLSNSDSFPLSNVIYNQFITPSAQNPIEFNVLFYKDASKNFTSPSSFTSYVTCSDNFNNFERRQFSWTGYIHPIIGLNNIDCFFSGSFTSDSSHDSLRCNAYIYNMGLSRTNMTSSDFDLFAQKMLKYDNYWHLFEGETDTPNISKSDILFYLPFYQKFGGNSSRSLITPYYAKTGVTITSLSNNNGPPQWNDSSDTLQYGRSRLYMKLGPRNRWRKPYPPFDPYI